MAGWSSRTFPNAQCRFGKSWLPCSQTRLPVNCCVPREPWFSLFKNRTLRRRELTAEGRPVPALARARAADNFRTPFTAREPRGTARKSPPRRAAGPPAADQRRAARRSAQAAARERPQAGPDAGRCRLRERGTDLRRAGAADAHSVHQPQTVRLQRRIGADAARGAGATLSRDRPRRERRFAAHRPGRSDRPRRLRRADAAAQARDRPRRRQRVAADGEHRSPLSPHRRDQRALARAHRRAGADRGRFRRRQRRRRRAQGRAGRQAAADAVRGRGPGARLRHPHRAAGEEPARALPHRRRAAPADRGRLEDRVGAGAAPEADVGPRHLRAQAAAGRTLSRRHPRQRRRRPHLDHADPVRRIGRDAPAQPEHRTAPPRPPRHAGADAGAACAKRSRASAA